MQSGKYDQRIRIEDEVRTPDGGGGSPVAWTPVAENPEIWAAVWAISSREQFAGGQLSGVSSYRVRIRRRDDLTTAHRLVWLSNGDMLMNIRGIIDNGRRVDYLELLVDTGVAT
jgi:SPP1 family predicted phage head-tail adaptor